MDTLRFEKSSSKLYLIYAPDQELDFIKESLIRKGSVTVKKVFHFIPEDLVIFERKEHYVKFFFAKLVKICNYKFWKVPARILGIQFDVYFDWNIDVKSKFFVAPRNISIFGRIEKLLENKQDFFILKGRLDKIDGYLPFSEFERLLELFPTTYELNKYSLKRIDEVLAAFFETKNVREDYENYLNKKLTNVKTPIEKAVDIDIAKVEFDKIKTYEKAYTLLEKMLREEAPDVKERVYQKIVKEIIQLLYPQYVYVIREEKIPSVARSKRPDFLLIDFYGNIDVMEIKRPDTTKLLRGRYRGNFLPSRELEGTIMQIEKYIYLLTGARRYLDKIYDKHKENLNKLGIDKLKVVYPKGIIVIGRDHNLGDDIDSDSSRKIDFEIIRRRSKFIMDILTYDELLRRLEQVIFTKEIDMESKV